MSRTYRKRNGEPFWYAEDEYNKLLEDKWYNSWWKDRSYKGAVAYYHSDSTDTMNQVPKWYKVQFCRRPFRRKEKVALIKEMKRDFDGEVPFPVIKKDALYYW